MKKYIPIFISPNSLIKYSLANIRSIHHRSVRNFSSQKKKKKKEEEKKMKISVPSFAYALSRERRVGRFDRKRNEKLARGGGKRGKGAKREKELWLGGGEPRRAFPLCASSLSRFRAGGQRGRYR